jgi:branched-chain amino acid transport system substrate-binding protein
MVWKSSRRITTTFAAAMCLSVSLVAIASAPAVAAKAKAKSAIIFGNEADLTGNATVGIPGSYGVAFAVKQINAHGGIAGHKIKLEVADSQGTATGGIAAVRKLVESDHAQVIVNTASSDSTVPALPVAQSAKVPFIVSAASDPVIIAKANTYVYMSPAVPVNLDVKEYIQYIVAQGYTSVALIYDTAAFADAAVADFQADAPSAGVKLATVQSFAYGTTDYSSQIAAAQSSGAQAVFVIGDFTGGVYTQSRNIGFNVPFMYDASATDPFLISSIGASKANGLVSFQTQAVQLLSATTAPMTTWVANFKADFPSAPAGVPSQFSLEGYEATYVAAEGVLHALTTGTKKLTGANIVKALNGLSGFVAGRTAFGYASPIGYPVTFSKNNHAGDSTITPVVVQNGDFKPLS